MEIILLEKVQKLGDIGDEVNVKAGYGRNYLIPKGKAVPATKSNVEEVQKRKAELEKVAQQVYAKAEERKAQLDGMEITIPAKAGEEGKLFGSIGNRDIASAIVGQGVEVEKSEVRMPLGPIRQAGEYEYDIQLHSDITGQVKIIVVPEE